MKPDLINYFPHSICFEISLATSGSGDSPITTKSVAERVRIVEQRQYDKQQLQQQPSPAGNGYSTKINVSLGASDEWTETGWYCKGRN